MFYEIKIKKDFFVPDDSSIKCIIQINKDNIACIINQYTNIIDIRNGKIISRLPTQNTKGLEKLSETQLIIFDLDNTFNILDLIKLTCIKKLNCCVNCFLTLK